MFYDFQSHFQHRCRTISDTVAGRFPAPVLDDLSRKTSLPPPQVVRRKQLRNGKHAEFFIRRPTPFSETAAKGGVLRQWHTASTRDARTTREKAWSLPAEGTYGRACGET
jgi:hypothetical protein